jgi:hypothetical protein
MTPTSDQISLLQHTIGVRPDQRNLHERSNPLMQSSDYR